MSAEPHVPEDRADDGADLQVDPEADPEADPESLARAICLRQLTMAPRTRSQLGQAMRKRNVPVEVGERVLDRLTEVGLVDDEAFAQAWVRSRHSSRGLARRALAHELRARGVDDEIAAEALSTLADDDELVAARALVERRLRSLGSFPYDVQARRLAGLLARKGYPAGVAARVVREALGARSDRSGGMAERTR